MIAIGVIVVIIFLLFISLAESKDDCAGNRGERCDTQQQGRFTKEVCRALSDMFLDKTDETYVGRRGERRVVKRLGKLPKDVYRVLNDIMLPTVDGTTTQIDQVVVSRFGIFVIETKNFGGWIFGSKDQRNWTQVFQKGYSGESEKFYFQNPIRQNWRHIYVLSDCLELPRRYFFNLVVFSGDGEFKTDMPENVIYSSELCSHIRSFDMPILSDAMVEKIVSKLMAIDAAISDESRSLHVSNLMAVHDPTQMADACESGNLKCPKCGSKMVLRHRKSDGAEFYGCTNYPNCRGTRQA